jgi:hypothetical protein
VNALPGEKISAGSALIGSEASSQKGRPVMGGLFCFLARGVAKPVVLSTHLRLDAEHTTVVDPLFNTMKKHQIIASSSSRDYPLLRPQPRVLASFQGEH